MQKMVSSKRHFTGVSICHLQYRFFAFVKLFAASFETGSRLLNHFSQLLKVIFLVSFDQFFQHQVRVIALLTLYYVLLTDRNLLFRRRLMDVFFSYA